MTTEHTELVALRSLYEVTGNIVDFNTLLVDRDALEARDRRIAELEAERKELAKRFVSFAMVEHSQVCTERDTLRAELDALRGQEPVAAIVEVRRVNGPWQRYNTYDSVAAAESTKQRVDLGGIEVKVVPLFATPVAPAQPAQDVWQPIETAPKDGTNILVCRATDADGNPMDDETLGLFTQRASWWGSNDKWVVYCSLPQEPGLFFEPTHWMPVPAAPQPPQEKKES